PLVIDKRLEFWTAMELSRKVVTRVWFEVFGLMLLAFLPFILTVIIVSLALGAKVWTALFTVLRDVAGSTTPNFERLFAIAREMATTNLIINLLVKLALLVNLPFAAGALMYAYENLFSPRRTPS